MDPAPDIQHEQCPFGQEEKLELPLIVLGFQILAMLIYDVVYCWFNVSFLDHI
jgi:hypothetical protein